MDDNFKIHNYKVRNQNIYTKISKNGLNVIVSDYIITLDVIDKDKLAHLLSVYKRLSLKPIEI